MSSADTFRIDSVSIDDDSIITRHCRGEPDSAPLHRVINVLVDLTSSGSGGEPYRVLLRPEVALAAVYCRNLCGCRSSQKYRRNCLTEYMDTETALNLPNLRYYWATVLQHTPI